MSIESRRTGFRASALALLSLTLCASCDLANSNGGPGPGPGSPGSVSSATGLGSGTFRASFKGIKPEANGGSQEPQLSSTGRYVAFASYADNLVAGDVGGHYDVFVRDRDTNNNGTFDEPGEGTTLIMSVATDGTQANSDSYEPKISGDGRFVTFISYADNLDQVTPDTNFNSDVFVHDRDVDGPGGAAMDEPGNISTVRVSKYFDGSVWVQSNSYSDSPDISDDGRFVTFYSYADNLLGPGGDTNGRSDVFVHDRDVSGNSVFDEPGDVNLFRVSVDSSGNESDSDSYNSAISGDGTQVAFYSYASNLVPGDTNGQSDIFVRDLTNSTTVRVSVATDGTESNQFSFLYGNCISLDGRYVVFTSYADNLVAGDSNGVYDCFLHDRDADNNGIFDEVGPGLTSTIRLSVASDGTQANSYCYYPSISDDGTTVVFFSYASNLVPNDTNGTYDTFVHETATGITVRVSVSTAGAQANGACYFASISGDGRMVAFYGYANNLIAQDTNGYEDCFVHDRDRDNDGIFDETTAGGTLTVRVSEVASTEPNSDSLNPVVSGDGNLIAFESDASDIIASDGNFARDIFVRDAATAANARASIANGGAEANSGSYNASISSDGRFVAFESDATNLVAGDDGTFRDIYLRGLSSTIRISVEAPPNPIFPNGPDGSADGNNPDGACLHPSVSGDGKYVAFDSVAADLVYGDSNAVSDIFIRDTVNNSTVRILTNGNGQPTGGGSFNPSISSTGRFVAFESDATDLPGAGIDTNGVRDIYVRDRDLDNNGIFDQGVGAVATVRMSVDSAGAQANGASRNPKISGDGRFVVFESDASNLVAGDTNGTTDIFVHDRDVSGSGTFDTPGNIATIRVSVATGGIEATGGASSNPVISEDGRFVAFQSLATNLAAIDLNGTYDVFRHEIATGETLLVSESTTGATAAGASTRPSISADGSFVVFQSPAADLVVPPGASHTNIYRRGPM